MAIGKQIMLGYLFKRLLILIPTFFGITLIVFFFIKLAPGSPATELIYGPQGLEAIERTPQQTLEIMKLYGLHVDLPAGYENFIGQATVYVHGSDPQGEKEKKLTRRFFEFLGQSTIQYGIWMKGLSRLDFGISFKDSRRVTDKIKEALPITLTLNLIEIFIVYTISVFLGVISAVRRNSVFDKTTMLILFVLYSLPSFWVATLLILYFSSGTYFDWFPLMGLMSDDAAFYSLGQKIKDIAWHLVLPVVSMVYGSFAFLTRFSRTNLLEVIQQDYIRTARAKGLNNRTVIWRHAFRNSLIPLITLLGTLLPALLGGSIIIEEIFNIPGMGRLAFQAVYDRDYPTVMAIATISAFLTLISLMLSDLAYALVDPRITFKAREGR